MDADRVASLHQMEPLTPAPGPRWVLPAKIAGTIALLAILLSVVDLDASIEAVRQVRIPWFLLAIATSAVAILLSVLKWERLVRDLDLAVSRPSLIRFYLMGLFASTLLPGMVGGDMVRWQALSHRSGRRIDAAATILAERAIGVLALVLCTTVAVALHARLATTPVLVLVGGMTVAIAGGLTLALNRRLATRAVYRRRHSVLRRFVLPLYRLHKSLRGFHRQALLATFALAVLFYATTSLTLYFVLHSFGVGLSYDRVFTVQVLTNLLTLLPISIGGLGLLQAGDVYLLGRYGVDAPTAFALSLVRQMIHYGWGFVGGALALQPWRTRVRGTDAT